MLYQYCRGINKVASRYLSFPTQSGKIHRATILPQNTSEGRTLLLSLASLPPLLLPFPLQKKNWPGHAQLSGETAGIPPFLFSLSPFLCMLLTGKMEHFWRQYMRSSVYLILVFRVKPNVGRLARHSSVNDYYVQCYCSPLPTPFPSGDDAC